MRLIVQGLTSQQRAEIHDPNSNGFTERFPREVALGMVRRVTFKMGSSLLIGEK